MTVRMVLLYLEKTLQSKFRGRPEIFNVFKNEKLGKTTKELMGTEFWMIFSFRQLLVWGKVDLELEGAVGMPVNLIAFAMALMGRLAGSMPGPGTGTPRFGARVRKVKKLINFNKLNPLAGKRKFDQVMSGSRDNGRGNYDCS